jgi:hypothetical protein
MTAPQIIQEIEAAGGFLALKGDRIVYDVPRAARALLDVVRERREEVLQTLRGRQDEAKQQISRWMATRCAVPRNPTKVWGSEKSLYRNYLGWCELYQRTPCCRELFGAFLDETFQREMDGWQGLCLTSDRAASKGFGGKLVYPASLATEVFQ